MIEEMALIKEMLDVFLNEETGRKIASVYKGLYDGLKERNFTDEQINQFFTHMLNSMTKRK